MDPVKLDTSQLSQKKSVSFDIPQLSGHLALLDLSVTAVPVLVKTTAYERMASRKNATAVWALDVAKKGGQGKGRKNNLEQHGGKGHQCVANSWQGLKQAQVKWLRVLLW